jgi:hypothetical protein
VNRERCPVGPALGTVKTVKPSRPEALPDPAQRLVEVGHVVQHADGDKAVEPVRPRVGARHDAFLGHDVRDALPAHALLQELDHGGRGVEPDDLPDLAGQAHGVVAGAGAELHDALVREQHALERAEDHLLLTGSDPPAVRRPREVPLVEARPAPLRGLGLRGECLGGDAR